MRVHRSSAVVAACAIVAGAWPAYAQSDGALTIRPYRPGIHRHGDRRTVASPNVPIEEEAGDSIDGPEAHGNCSTAGGGSGNAAMADSNC